MGKRFLILLMAVTVVALSSTATKIYVCGTKITGTTSFQAGGGTVSYNDDTKTLNITNVNYEKNGSSNNGISVDDISDTHLTINMYGNVSFTIGDADAVLCKDAYRTVTINVYGTAYFISKSSSHGGLKAEKCDVNLYGTGTLYITNSSTSSDASAIRCGNGNEVISFKIKDCTIQSNGQRIYNGGTVYFSPTNSYGTGDYSTMSTIIRFKPGTNNSVHVSAYGIFLEGLHILVPINYYGQSNSDLLYNTSIAGSEIQVTDYVPAVILNSTKFPDANLCSHLQYLEPKGYLTTSEMNNYTYLNLSSLNISNLQGIDQFKNLKELRVENNNLTSLSTLPSSLQTLNCSSNKFSGTFSLTGRSALKTLNISGNTGLTTINCYNNALTSLSLSGCSALTTLNCYSNQLTSLGTLPSSLQIIDCSSNKFSGTFSLTGRSALKSLNVSSNTGLTTLNCYSNALTSLNVSGCSALTTLNCYSNQLASLGTLPTSLQTIDCSSNKFSGTFSLTGRSALKTLNISYNTSLTTLNCYSNALTSLNVSGCSALTTLSCYSNQLSSLGTLPTSLQTIDCSSNKFSGTFSLTGRSALKSLNISNNTNLTALDCQNNQLTSLNVSGCTALTSLNCSMNKFSGTFSLTGRSALKTLNISYNTSLTTLNCYSNALTSLNVFGCSALTALDCHNNQLTDLDSPPVSLQTIDCSSNKFSGKFLLIGRSALKTLNVSNNTSITTLNCSENGLTNFNVSGCSALTSLDCSRNQLTSLDLSGLSSLKELYCYYNEMTSLSNVPNSIEIIECQNNKFTGLTMSNKPALKILLCNNNTSMTALYAQNNAISNLGVTGCSALKILYCNGNKLSSLSLDRCSALNEFTIARNQISGSYMTSLINTLRSIPTSEEEGIFMVYNKDRESEEGNAITDDQIESARAKRWIPKKYQNNEWVWATIRGDVNGDGVCNAADITALYNWILNGDKTSLKNGYQNDDNVINAGDITTVYNIILGN